MSLRGLFVEPNLFDHGSSGVGLYVCGFQVRADKGKNDKAGHLSAAFEDIRIRSNRKNGGIKLHHMQCPS